MRVIIIILLIINWNLAFTQDTSIELNKEKISNFCINTTAQIDNNILFISGWGNYLLWSIENDSIVNILEEGFFG